MKPNFASPAASALRDRARSLTPEELARIPWLQALDELLNRFPEWVVDPAGMKLAPTSTVRGWESMPIVLP